MSSGASDRKNDQTGSVENMVVIANGHLYKQVSIIYE